MHRQPAVTSVAVHPSGHILAIGHTDGSIAFWAVDDDSAPLTVFTFDEDNVHMVDQKKLDEHLKKEPATSHNLFIREPIIKLAWSGFPNSQDPRGGETVLTVLGGLDPLRGGNITVLWFPAFQPSNPPAGALLQPGELHPFFRQVMLESVSPIDLVEYDIDGEAQDFLLIPKDNPHYDGTYDPYAIICLVGSQSGDRIVRAFTFPPARSIPPRNAADPDREAVPSVGASPATIPIADEPHKPSGSYNLLGLPFQLACGGTTGGQLMTLDQAQYERIRSQGQISTSLDSRVVLDGGRGFSDQSKMDEARLTKVRPPLSLLYGPQLHIFTQYQPRRILITYSRDLRVFLSDVSAQLLISPQQEPLTNHFPHPLPGLTVDIGAVWEALIARGKRDASKPPSIQAISFAPDAVEVATTLNTGDVVVHRSAPVSKNMVVADEDITVLFSVQQDPRSKLYPYFALKGPDQVEACSISDIGGCHYSWCSYWPDQSTGFLAVSYTNGSLVVVDMRGPRVIYKRMQGGKERHRLSLHQSADVPRALTWTVSSLNEGSPNSCIQIPYPSYSHHPILTCADAQLRVRLLVSRRSGSLEVVTLTPTGYPAVWSVDKEPTLSDGVSDPLDNGTFVLDSKTGNRRNATGAMLATSFNSQTAESPVLCVTVGEKGARVYVNISGERIAKVDWGIRAGNAISAQIVGRMGGSIRIFLK